MPLWAFAVVTLWQTWNTDAVVGADPEMESISCLAAIFDFMKKNGDVYTVD